MKLINRTVKYCLLLLLFSGTGPWLMAQSEEIQLKVYGFEEGLSHRNVYKIQQDTYGFIWLATVNGLNKYDGYQFETVGFENAGTTEPDDFIVDMVIDSLNRIWLVHPNGITILSPNTEKRSHLVINSESLARGNEQTPVNLQVQGNGEAWMATYKEKQAESVLQKVSIKGDLKVNLPLPGQYEDRPILIKGDTLYVGANENELWKLDQEGRLLDKYSFSYQGYTPASSRIVDLVLDAKGTMYCLLRNGKVFYQHQRETSFSPHPVGEVTSGKGKFSELLVEENGDLWLMGEHDVLYYDLSTRSVKDLNEEVRKISGHLVTYRQLFRDQSGVIWLASDFGAIKLVRSRRLFTTYLSGGNANCSSGFCSIRGITEDEDGNIYIAYYNSTHRLNPSTGELTPLIPQSNYINPPFGLIYYRGKLFAGNGVRVDLASLQIDSLLPGPLVDQGALLIDQNDQLILAYKDRVYQYNTNKQDFEEIDQPSFTAFSDQFTHLHQGQRSDNIWVGTQTQGVYLWDETQQTLSPFAGPQTELPLQSPRILCSYEDNRGNLWVGTAEGLHKIDLVAQSVVVYTEEQGLPNNFINGILSEGDSCLWISTDNGLARMDVLRGKITGFSKKDGLPANEFNRISFFQSRDGRMYFGGMNGVTAFYPGPEYVEKKEETAGKMLFTAFSKYDGELDTLIYQRQGLYADQGIDLSFRDKFFTFQFALANFVNPRENQYSYKLEGYETDWSPPTRLNSVRYHNIPAGEYTFKVRASSGGNNWNNQELTIPVTIQQAYFRTPWFIISCAILVIGSLLGFMRYRIFLANQREQKLTQLVEARTHELKEEQEKSEKLLLNILPADTAQELKQSGKAKAKRYEAVTVMFTDFAGFTRIAEQLEPEELVQAIDACFRKFDEIVERHQLEKIKTIGDSYLCVGGLRGNPREQACRMVAAAREIQAFAREAASGLHGNSGLLSNIRIGIHTGPIVAGIVGSKKFAYDIWGDTVNLASRMESNSQVGRINISEETFRLVQENYDCTYRGKITAKNKGQIDMYFVEGPIASSQPVS